MDYDEYQRAFFTDPAPAERFRFTGSFGVSLYFQDFHEAVAYYAEVLGSPHYVEGEGTRGWRVGGGWLTLLRGYRGSPRNVEVTFEMGSPGEAERLQRAFIEAGGTGPPPSDELMYVPVRSCPVRDPFDTELLITARLDDTSR